MLIRTRLWLLEALILGSIALIIVLVGQAFSRTERIAANLIDTHLDQVIDNATHTRRLATISTKVELLSQTLLVGDGRFEADVQEIQTALHDLRLATANDSLRALIERYSQGFDDFLSTCLIINETLDERRVIDRSAHAELDALERLISDWLIDAALTGRDKDYANQLLGLATGYRESLLRVGILHAEQDGPNALGVSEGDISALEELDDLHLRLQTISASISEVSELGRRLSEDVIRYRDVVVRLRLRVREWQDAQRVLRDMEAKTVATLADRDQASLALANRAGAEIETVIDDTRNRVLSLSLLVVAVMGLAIAHMARRHIEVPLKRLSEAIGAIHPKTSMQPLGLHLENEWGVIEQALDRMGREFARSYARVKESEARYRLLVHNQSDMVVKIDTEGRFLYVSPVCCQTFGKEEIELLGHTFLPLVHEDDRAATAKAMEALHRPPHTVQVEQRALTKNGWRWLSWSGRAVLGEDGSVIAIIGVGRDITPEKEQRRQLERFAHYDPLTDLPNRVLLADRLRQAMYQHQRRRQRLVVAYLDLDGFKKINDSHGHDVGDRFLVAEAKRLHETLRQGDTIARIGGDEFVIVLLDIADEEEAIPIIERLLDVAARPMQHHDEVLRVSVSLGATFYPQPEPIAAEQLLRQADQAMYQAKLAGRNSYRFFDADLDRAARSHQRGVGAAQSRPGR